MSCAAPCLAPSVDYFFISASRQNSQGVGGDGGVYIVNRGRGLPLDHTKEMSQSILIYWNNFRSVSVTLLLERGCGSLNESLDLQALHREIK